MDISNFYCNSEHNIVMAFFKYTDEFIKQISSVNYVSVWYAHIYKAVYTMCRVIMTILMLDEKDAQIHVCLMTEIFY